jgi:hypothetical protein
LAIPPFDLEGGYEGYRKGRRKFLEIYAFALLEKHRTLKRVVGIATEPKGKSHQLGSSEDLIVVEPGEWKEDFLHQLEEAKRTLNILQDGNFSPYPVQENEFPELEPRPDPFSMEGKSKRKRRRARGKSKRSPD